MRRAGRIPIPAHPRFEDLTGQRFGRLMVLYYEGRYESGSNSKWRVVCDCGQVRSMKSTNLKQNQSCGCVHSELVAARNTTHGLTKGGTFPPLYHIWAGMVRRCNFPSSHCWDNYGGRGIEVCQLWMAGDGKITGFECFVRDVGPRPSDLHSIDRINNDGNYEPGNVRWATSKEQNNNRRPRRAPSGEPSSDSANRG